jgi:hypothetical protein
VGDWWGAVGLYGLGVLTGAVLCGWSPQFLERWEARRRAQEERHQAWRIKREILKVAEKARSERVKQGKPAEITDAEWEDYLTTKKLKYGPWGDDGQSCLWPRRDEPNSTPQAW